MAQRLRYATEFQPDFGLPYDPRFEDNLKLLPDAQLQKLVRIKDWLDSNPTISPKQFQQALATLAAPTRPFAVRYWSEKNAREDPVQFGYNLPSWSEVMANWCKYNTHVICGGNRSSKSVFAARLVVWALINIPECRIRCFQVNDEKSIAEQQAYIWDALPSRYKTMTRKKGEVHSIQFSQKNGFSGNKLILPAQPGYERGSEVMFGTYQQYKADPQITEGWWAHLIWCDEEAPQKMFERLLTRLYDAKGRMLLTFTTIQGWSPLVADILGRTKTLLKRFSELLGREIAVAQESLTRASTRIYYFWTQDNYFIPSDTIERLRGRPQEEILAVAHGIPSRPAMSKFPKFDESVHVLPPGQMPWLLPYGPEEEEREFTRYHIIDCSGSKPWFLLYVAVDITNTLYAYREWPDMSYGTWGEPGETPEGKRGPAQKPNGWGIKEYVDLFKQLEDEGKEPIFERVIDPRLGAAIRPTQEGATSIISELEDAGITVIPAPALLIDNGLQLVTNKLSWDQARPVDALNRPGLYISEDCPNLIDAFKNYSGLGGKDEVWKDPIDCLRYLMENGADFIGKAALHNNARTFSY